VADDRPLDRFGISPPPAYDMTSWRLPFPLRDFQEEAIKELIAKGRGTVLLPTGAGKTHVAIALLLELRQPMVVLVPTKALIDTTWLPKLLEGGIHAGVYFGEEKRPGFVTLATYQTLMRNPEAIRAFPIVVFDEGDLSVGPVWRKVLEEAKTHPYAMVMTATLPTDNERRRELLADFPVLVRRSPREMIEAGHFVPVEVLQRVVQLSPDAKAAYDKFDQHARNLRFRLGTGSIPAIQRILAGSRGRDMAAVAGAYLRTLQQRSTVLANVPERAPIALDIARAHPGERIILFGTRVEPLAEICAYLTSNGVPCRVISGETGRSDRQAIFQHWGRDVPVIGSVDVLTRGIDVPEASVAVLMGGGAGERRLIQRVGRIVRPAPGKTVATVYVMTARGTNEERLYEAARRRFAGGKYIEERGEPEDDGGEPE